MQAQQSGGWPFSPWKRWWTLDNPESPCLDGLPNPQPKTQQQNPPASRSRGCFVGPHRWYRHPLKIDSAHGPKESYQRMPWAIAARSPGVYDESSAQLLRRSGGTKHWWGRCPRKPWLSEVVVFWREKIGRLGFNIRSYRRKYEWSM